MKITAVNCIPLSVPLEEPIKLSFGEMRARPAFLVEVCTDTGVNGWGEAWVNFPSWSLIEKEATLKGGVIPHLIGANPLDIVGINEKLHSTLRTVAIQWGAPGPINHAISAIDIALWDILGKVTGQPIYRLLGGEQRPIPVYASGIGPRNAVEVAHQAVTTGYRALKLKVGFGKEIDLANVKAIRQAVGADIELMVDANQAWGVEESLRMIDCLAPFDVTWIEEPLLATDMEGMTFVRERSSIPIAAGENAWTFDQMRRMLEANAVDILQPDVCKCGGISQARAASALCQAWHKPFAPHMLGAGIGLAASLHWFAGSPGGRILEVDSNVNPLRTELFEETLPIVDGCMQPPNGPGLGVTVNQEVVARYRVDQSRY